MLAASNAYYISSSKERIDVVVWVNISEGGIDRIVLARDRDLQMPLFSRVMNPRQSSSQSINQLVGWIVNQSVTNSTFKSNVLLNDNL